MTFDYFDDTENISKKLEHSSQKNEIFNVGNEHQTTIAAISTAFGEGGISTIRISGPDAKIIAGKVFKGKKLIQTLGDYCGCYGKAYDDNKLIDEVIVLNFNGPKSYTGEDVVEMSCHGGMYVSQKLLETVLKSGATYAQPGEFTKRAFLNGKISLTQAESVMDVISAHTKQALEVALELKKGNLYIKITKIIQKLVELQGHLTAWIDFPEEDVAEITHVDITKTLVEVRQQLEILSESFDKGQILKNGIKTVITGKPNVGKSTLMNALAGCEKSIVTEIPGTTRDVVEEQIVLAGITLLLSDTAGVRHTIDTVEAAGVKLTKEKLQSAQLILAVFDSSRKMDDDDNEILQYANKKPFIAIINKSDLPPVLQIDMIKKTTENIIYISAKNSNGLKELEQMAAKVLKIENVDTKAPFIANQRQNSCVLEAINNIKEALSAIEAGITFDAISLCVESATEKLMELTGQTASEEIIDEVFSKFCVGK